MKRLFAILLTLCILFTQENIVVFASELAEASSGIATQTEIVTSGTLGDNGGFQWTYDTETKTLIVTGEDSGLSGKGRSPFYQIDYNMEKIVFENCKFIGSMSYLFYCLRNLKEVQFFNIDTSNVIDMSHMFDGCYKLAALDVSNFDTSNVIDMSHMFDGCYELDVLNVSNFDTSNVTNMSWMFYGCDLESLDVSNFDTSNVIDMSRMFYGCTLGSLDVSNFDTSNVTDMSGMFDRCELSSLDVSNFDTSNVTDMSEMFYLCEGLGSLDISNFDTSNVTDMSGMFDGCSGLGSLDVSNFDTSNVIDMSYMFTDCSGLGSLDVSNFNTSNVIDMLYMFSDCSGLGSLDVSNFDISNMTQRSSTTMFSGCNSLEIIHSPKVIPEGKYINLPDVFYDSQMNSITQITSDCENLILVRDKSVQDDSISADKFLLQVVDSNGFSISNVTVTYDGQTGTTDERGRVTFDLSNVENPVLTVSKTGYMTWTNTDGCFSLSGSNNEKIVLYGEEEGEGKLKVVTFNNIKSSNLLMTAKTLSLKKSTNETGDFSLICLTMGSTDIQEYQLWQKNKKIATTTTGEFLLNVDDGFVEGGDCYIRVVTTDGKEVDSPINLSFTSNELNKNNVTSIKTQSGSFNVGENVPYFGGQKLEIEVPNLPITCEVTDEKIYIGFNVDLASSATSRTMASNGSSDEEVENYFKKVKKLVNSAKNSAKKNANDLKDLIKNSDNFKLPGGEFDTTIVGYAEAEWGSDIATGALYISITGKSPTLGFNTFVGVVPVTVHFNATAEATAGAELSFNLADFDFSDGGIDLSITGELYAFGGVGVGEIAGIGAYGNAGIATKFRFLGTEDGLKNVDLSGELGIKAYVSIFTYEKAFLEATWHLYPESSTRPYSLGAVSQYDIYNAKNYTIESLAYLEEESEWNGNAMMLSGAEANNSLVSLIENTYRNAQPVMISDGNIAYVAFLRADETTNRIYAVCTKLENGVWSEPVQADATAILDDAPQLLLDEEGTLWMAYATTLEEADNTSLLSYAQNQQIVIGTIDKETLLFTPVKTYNNTDYSHSQQLALVDGVPTLVWVESTVTDDNSVLASDKNKVIVSSYSNGVWSNPSEVLQINSYMQELTIGDTGVACILDTDQNLNTLEDLTLKVYDWQGTEISSKTGVRGNITYGILPGKEKESFLWNGTDQLCSLTGSVAVAGITKEYSVIGDSIYYSVPVADGAELAVIKRNSDGTFGESIQLTETDRYLENLSVVTINGTDVVLGMHTNAIITEDSVIPEKNLVWSIVQPVNDLRIDVLDYDDTVVTPNEMIPVTVTVTNGGDHEVNEVDIVLDGNTVTTEKVDLLPGGSTELTFEIPCPENLTEYMVQVVDASGDITMDYTQENNKGILKVGYGNISVDAGLQQIGESRLVVAKVENNGTESVSGKVALYDEAGQLLSLNTFTDLTCGNKLYLEMPLYFDIEDSTLSVVVTTEQEELYTYDNSDTVYVSKEAEEEVIEYTITYMLDGGVQNEGNPQTYYKSTENILLLEPTREGYVFEGWYSDQAFTTEVSEIAAEMEGNLVFYAKWKPLQYTITYHLEGGINNSNNPESYTMETPTIILKNPTRSGFTFGGWYSDSTYKTKVTSINKGSTGDRVLYAKWIADTYMITYYLNGGTNHSGNPLSYNVTTDTITLKAPSRKGYSFEGWYSDSNYKTKVITINKGSTGNKTLYAKWSANTYNIIFNGNGATSGSTSSMLNRVYDVEYILNANMFKNKGYTFIGWNTQKDGKGKAYKNNEKVKNLISENGNTLTLYAQWKKIKYTITYKLNGGKNSSKNKTSYYVTTSNFKLKNPTRKGYTFKGWYTDKKCTKKITQIKKGSTKNYTLYAKWSKKKYTITYVLNKGKNNKSNKKTYYVTTNTFKLKNPTRKGYTFKGWYSDKKCTKKVTKIKKGSTGNMKLYAKWVKKK